MDTYLIARLEEILFSNTFRSCLFAGLKVAFGTVVVGLTVGLFRKLCKRFEVIQKVDWRLSLVQSYLLWWAPLVIMAYAILIWLLFSR